MRNSAVYVARVGGLAVALGIGTAVATGQGLALADSPDGAPAPSSNDPSQSKSESPDVGPPAGPAASAAPGQGAGSGSPSSPVSNRDVLAGSGTVHSSGGAQTSSNPSTSVDTTSDDPPASTPISTSEASTTGPVDTEPDTSGEGTDTPASGQPAADLADQTEPAPQSAGYSTTTSHRLSQTDSKPAGDVDAGPLTADATTSTADAKLQAVEVDFARTTGKSASTVATLSAADSQPVIDQVAAAQQVPTMTAPGIVGGLLTAFGLGPLATTDPPAPAAPPPTLLGLMEWIRREINRTFFNQAPTMAYDPAENSLVDGSLVGKLTAADPDSAILTFTATKPAHGEVTVDPDGTFTYTPDATFAGHDSFDVTVSDASSGFQIHGLSGLINLVTFGLLGDRGDSYTRTISVDGFTATTVVSGLDQPTDFRFLPDGRILIAEKGGAIKVADQDGQLQSAPLITLPTPTAWARGLLAVEVDPDYQDNGYIYVSYVEPENNYERLSRLTVTDPTAAVLTVDPHSEVVLVDGTQPAGDDHLGGGLSFGPDGKLYWSVGDNVCCSVLDGRNSQNLTNMYGKVLRLNPDGTAPADNPFYDGDGPNYDAIYATGFRNPFRLAFTPDGELLVADVGQATWEEVNLVTAGANYGWPNAEGPCNGIGTPSCSTPSSYANPIYAYRHTTGGNSITAVMVYTGATSVSGQNTVLIADFNQGWVKELTFNSDYSSLISERLFNGAAPGNTNKLVQGPDGSIYQLTFDGKLSRIAPSSDVLSV
jgi:VCBS repeat-containing protein